MFRTALSSFSVFFLLGCASNAINAEAQDKRSDALTVQRTLTREPSCATGGDLGPSCGLLMKRLGSDDFRARFAAKRCVDVVPSLCREAYVRLVSAALEDRYPAADPEVVKKSCRGRGENCGDPIGYELVLMDSHNAAISDLTARRELAIEAERERRQAQYARDAYATAMTALFVLHDGPKCSSHRGLGDTTLTFCKR